MSEANLRVADFVKGIFVSHLEDKNIEESYKHFTDDADIFRRYFIAAVYNQYRTVVRKYSSRQVA